MLSRRLATDRFSQVFRFSLGLAAADDEFVRVESEWTMMSQSEMSQSDYCLTTSITAKAPRWVCDNAIASCLSCWRENKETRGMSHGSRMDLVRGLML